jgi:hypothetical protein
MAYTFADAMVRYTQQMRQADLGEAYKRTGLAFRSQLQQNKSKRKLGVEHLKKGKVTWNDWRLLVAWGSVSLGL